MRTINYTLLQSQLFLPTDWLQMTSKDPMHGGFDFPLEPSYNSIGVFVLRDSTGQSHHVVDKFYYHDFYVAAFTITPIITTISASFTIMTSTARTTEE